MRLNYIYIYVYIIRTSRPAITLVLRLDPDDEDPKQLFACGFSVAVAVPVGHVREGY